MTIRSALLLALTAAVACLAPKIAIPQEPAVIPLSSEPHHHLALHNAYVNVYQVEVAPHDSVRLHRHDADAISLMLSDAVVTVQSPGKRDVHSKLENGQIRLQRNGYVHSTTIDSDTPYRNVTVELLLPQTGAHNICAQVIPSQPISCPVSDPAPGSPTFPDQQEFETDQTSLMLVRISPHQSAAVAHAQQPMLVVALDPVVATGVDGKGPAKALPSGNFLWIEKGGSAGTFKNDGDKEVRLICFTLKAEPPATAAR
jgi:hypothetical protein